MFRIWSEFTVKFRICLVNAKNDQQCLAIFRMFSNVQTLFRISSTKTGLFRISLISQQPENCENRHDPDLVQAFLRKWWVESNFKAPNLPLSLRFKGSGYWTRAITRCALFDLLKSLYSDTKILSKYIPSLQKRL
jgi:hypothetical protein